MFQVGTWRQALRAARAGAAARARSSRTAGMTAIRRDIGFLGSGTRDDRREAASRRRYLNPGFRCDELQRPLLRIRGEKQQAFRREEFHALHSKPVSRTA